MHRKHNNFILDKKLNINGRNIYCKVTGFPHAKKQSDTYILVIPGGPGLGLKDLELQMQNLLDMAVKKGIPEHLIPHFILFDPLGCGKSDKGNEDEYTVDHFTDLNAKLIEAIKGEFKLKKMELYVIGESFGGCVAVNFPARKSDWLENNSSIQLKQIVSIVGANGADEKDYAYKYLYEHFHNDPNYQKMLAALDKLFTGDIQNKQDYIQNFVLPMANIYAKEIDQSWIYNALFKLTHAHPNFVAKTVGKFAGYLNKLGFENEEIAFEDSVLNGCAIDVLNHFFKHDFHGFNLIETVTKHRDNYSRLPICMINADEDHMVDKRIASTIHDLLPKSSAVITLKDSHVIKEKSATALYDKLMFSLLMTKTIPVQDLQNSKEIIPQYIVPDEYQNLLVRGVTPSKLKVGSTTEIFTEIGSDKILNSNNMDEFQIQGTTDPSITKIPPEMWNKVFYHLTAEAKPDRTVQGDLNQMQKYCDEMSDKNIFQNAKHFALTCRFFNSIFNQPHQQKRLANVKESYHATRYWLSRYLND